MIKYIILAIAVLFIILFIILYCKKHVNIVFNVALRTVFGVSCIYLLNALLDNIGLKTMVGINGISVITVATLGVPGIILLYGGTYILKN